ncbi:MAG: sarcosine oxidase subunit gamma [Rhodobacteraceae bacterium]|nr:sarcosine oxidase subunit gamma [Paracoccaceae bacterium]
MAEITLVAKSPLAGHDLTIAGTRLRELPDVALTSFSVPLGAEAAFDAALKSDFGVARPAPTTSTAAGDMRALPLAADQILVMHPEGAAAKALSKAAYSTEQTSNWCCVEISGPLAHAAMERLCPLDLHPDVFPRDAAARTTMEHMGALIIRTGSDSFVVLSASSSARSFWHALEVSLKNVS